MERLNKTPDLYDIPFIGVIDRSVSIWELLNNKNDKSDGG